MVTLQILITPDSHYRPVCENNLAKIYRTGRWHTEVPVGSLIEVFNINTSGKDVIFGEIISVKPKTKAKDISNRFVYRYKALRRGRSTWTGYTGKGSGIK